MTTSEVRNKNAKVFIYWHIKLLNSLVA
jgi:hypothetical protein